MKKGMIGVVADDITGANDIGIMFAKSGYKTHVYAEQGVHSAGDPLNDEPDVMILDTDSRFDSPETSYDKVFEATRRLKDWGCRVFFNKTCSVFRGNIGPEFDAMQDALEEEFSLVVLGFPKNGRMTKKGIHYVHGTKLEDPEFRNDPMHPMTQSSLPDILTSQTKRKVASIDYNVIRKGPEKLKAAISDMKHKCRYLILDVLDQDDLATISRAAADDSIFCGSSALAEELAKVWGAPAAVEDKANLPSSRDTGVLCVAGSLMPQTKKQIKFLKEKGVAVYKLNTLEIFHPSNREKAVQDMVQILAAQLVKGRDVVIHSENEEEVVRQTKDIGRENGLTNKDISRLVSNTIADITVRTVKETGLNRLLIAGGDTSAVVCGRLGISGVRVWQEIQPGLPSCLSLTDPSIFLVLKSGSFGSDDFFARAIEHLKV